jgi:hypothetical protein
MSYSKTVVGVLVGIALALGSARQAGAQTANGESAYDLSYGAYLNAWEADQTIGNSYTAEMVNLTYNAYFWTYFAITSSDPATSANYFFAASDYLGTTANLSLYEALRELETPSAATNGNVVTCFYYAYNSVPVENAAGNEQEALINYCY